MNIQIRHIRSFIAVAEEKSFARAAERLNVSQPALSQTIIQFEETLGFVLFERTTRSVVLTKPGEALLSKAQKANRAMDDLQAGARTIQLSLKNELRVGFMIGTAVELIPEIVREFERRRPGAQLRLTEFDFTDPSAGLRDHKVDCAIIRPPVGLDDIELLEITREKCVVCVPSGHELARRAEVVLADVLDEPIVAAPLPGIWRDYWLAHHHRDGRPAKVVFEAATVESELQAVAMGKGISITAESTAKYYARPGVVFRPITDMEECSIAIGYYDTSNRLLADLVSVITEISRPWRETR